MRHFADLLMDRVRVRMRSTNALFKAALLMKGPEQASMLMTIRFELATVLTLGKGMAALSKEKLVDLDPEIVAAMKVNIANLEEIFSDLVGLMDGSKQIGLADIYERFEPLAQQADKWREMAKRGDKNVIF